MYIIFINTVSNFKKTGKESGCNIDEKHIHKGDLRGKGDNDYFSTCSTVY
jgi:hypothetical protein